MTCGEIENRLPAYRENLLSPEERKIIAGHLISCPRCSRSLESLKKAEALVHRLGEVEPPPFFEQRIMSRIRQEAVSEPGILRRLFYPLHIKIPIQALATLLIAVLTIYVYQSGEPDMKVMAPLPLPMTDLEKGRVADAPPGSLMPPPARVPVGRAPAGGEEPSEKSQQRFTAPPPDSGRKEEKRADAQVTTGEARPSAVKPADPLTAERGKEAPPAREEASDRAPAKAGMQETHKMFETHPPPQKGKARMSDAGAGVRESVKTTPAPSPSRMTAAAAMEKRSVIDLTIRINDADIAVREIEARLGQVNARIIERQDRRGREFLKAEMAARNVAAFLDLLDAIGKVEPETVPPVVPEGNVTINIKIVVHQ